MRITPSTRQVLIHSFIHLFIHSFIHCVRSFGRSVVCSFVRSSLSVQALGVPCFRFTKSPLSRNQSATMLVLLLLPLQLLHSSLGQPARRSNQPTRTCVNADDETQATISYHRRCALLLLACIGVWAVGACVRAPLFVPGRCWTFCSRDGALEASWTLLPDCSPRFKVRSSISRQRTDPSFVRSSARLTVKHFVPPPTVRSLPKRLRDRASMHVGGSDGVA